VTVEDGRGQVARCSTRLRPARVLNIMTEDEAIKGGVVDGRRRYFRVTDGKNNLALPADKHGLVPLGCRSTSATATRTDPHDRGRTTWGPCTAMASGRTPALTGVSGEDFEKAVAVIRARRMAAQQPSQGMGRATPWPRRWGWVMSGGRHQTGPG
jgi:hypothetical protein